VKKKTVSDLLAKNQCTKYLLSTGYSSVIPAKGYSCDLLAYKESTTPYMFEIKYSTKENGDDFFGTVMFSELF
jgi:hypothetical protein